MSLTSDTVESAQSNSPSGLRSLAGTVKHGLVGGVAGALLSIVPLSEVAGGALAGYLERGNGGDSTVAGAIAGVVAFAPYALVAGYLMLSPGVALPGPDLAVPRTVVIGGVAIVAFVYVVGLAILGSLLGASLRETP